MVEVELRFEVDAELVDPSRANGHEPQDVLERGLREAADRPLRWSLADSAREKAKDPEGAERRAREWAGANKEAIDERYQLIAEPGLFADSARRW